MSTIFEQYSLVPTFDIFWEEYQKKVGKVAAEKWWNKLTPKEKQDCMEAVPLYVASTPDKQFRKDPERYLRHKAFYDEIIDRSDRRNRPARDKVQGILEAVARQSGGNGDDPSGRHQP